MRGKRKGEKAGDSKPRITPADAGKTPICKRIRCRKEDHPRGCGENALAAALQASYSGSPPRMRGKLKLVIRKMRHVRITPADAGKTNQHILHNAQSRDHPRGCGENAMYLENDLA